MKTVSLGKSQLETESQKCFHCGDLCADESLIFEAKTFCCNGCKSVYQLLQTCQLDGYYDYAENPGIKRLKASPKEAFAYLDDPDIIAKLLTFSSGSLEKIELHLPAIHCASCIWLIENFRKLVPGVVESRVNFVKRKASFSYDPSLVSLRHLVEQLALIGYEPDLNLEHTAKKKLNDNSKKTIFRIGLAGFCFGNIMLLSFPDYLSIEGGVQEAYRSFFGYLNFALGLPVLLISAREYLHSAYTAMRQKRINMDVPIALGILALFFRSSYEIFFEGGGGYMDSLAALIFFLLIGKWIQQRTFDSLSFERDYKSYFPIAVQIFENGVEKPIGIEKLAPGDRYIIRSGELVPADSVLVEGIGAIDYSFVSGESDPIRILAGDKIFAGGRQMGAALTLEAIKPVNQSYLTSLWNAEENKTEHRLEAFADRVGRRFTYVVIFIALSAGAYWLVHDPSIALNAVSAVLIVACPCALALSFPFAFGNAVRYLGRHGLYLKNAHALGKMAEVSHIVFDKTGTLTRKGQAEVKFLGKNLENNDVEAVKAVTSQSSHPLSRYVSAHLAQEAGSDMPEFFEEVMGKGIKAVYRGRAIKLGSAGFIGQVSIAEAAKLYSEVHLEIDGTYFGKFIIDKSYHAGLSSLIRDLKRNYKLYLLSGDGPAERERIEHIFDQKEGIYFNQSPHGKKAFLKDLSNCDAVTAMVGDGLNDAGALEASDFGISVADDVFRFSPASDAILASTGFDKLNRFFGFSKRTLNVIRWSFVFSFLYNAVGIFFAVQGLLTPVIAAILMPLSSITVVSFVTIGTTMAYRKELGNEGSPKPDKSQFIR